MSRAFGMLFRPARTLEAIAEAPGRPRALILRYAAPLAAIPMACGITGALVFGFSIANVGLHVSPVGVVLGAAAGWLATLVAVCLLAGVLAFAGPLFGGRGGWIASLNLTVYAATASWVGGLAELYPTVGIAVGVLAGLYSLYALYLGLAKLLDVPGERRLIAFAALLLVIALLGWARSQVVAKATELGGPLSASYTPR